MNNKMNIDMGDFFGSGAEVQAAKKDKGGRGFGFGGLMSSKPKSATASPINARGSAKKPEGDDFENPMDFGAPQSLRSAQSAGKAPAAPATKAPNPPSPAGRSPSPPSANKVIIDPEVKVSPKPVVPEPKLLPRAGSMRDPASPPQYLPPPKTGSQTPSASPIITPKTSIARITTEETKSISSPPNVSSPSAKGSDKSPPPLPPRPLSPRAAPKKLDELVTPLGEAKSPVPDVTSKATSTPPSVDVVKTPVSVGTVPLPSPVESQAAPAAKLGDNVRKTSITEAKSTETKTEPLRRLSSVKTIEPSVRQSDAKPKDVVGMVQTEELRSVVAPWTVWSEDPDKTLANAELRSAVAPWTLEPEPEPEQPRGTLAREQSTGSVAGDADQRRSPVDKNIAMDSFFRGAADDGMDGEDEFVNPMLEKGEQGANDEEGMFSMSSVTKKTWIGTRTGGSVVEKPKAAQQEKKSVAEPKKVEAPKKKAIDYGEVFKSAAVADDDDANAFMNDPEFRDAPDFEW